MLDKELLLIELNKELVSYSEINLKLWEKSYESFNLFIFSAFLEEELLEKKWEELRNDIALYFQSRLDNQIELWNIYIIFFIENTMKQNDLKYKIENDHYCARKIVFDNVGDIKDDEKRIKDLISKKLFDLEVPKISEVNNIDDLEKELNLIDSRLIDLNEINKLINKYKD